MKQKIDRTIFVGHKSSLLPCVYEYALSCTHRKIINYLPTTFSRDDVRDDEIPNIYIRVYIYIYNTHKHITSMPNQLYTYPISSVDNHSFYSTSVRQ